ncbi:Gfo/Idh/MocA family oxidoreductase [Agromyces sp. H3Y2-19a]|jgi:predicted dehydrogenase|uniref:Gfo/Idh/MocA family protein n=1 Tax=Agromyces chromiiresistens TaxID=3030835 RepID=UPI0023B8AF9E|nr:Gfo/Idh/MocA family oxidoreductase [Agromyces chromiiresistens]MDF0514527.1 Gfo/Idh/MocA family oxidoreductase [Agromyces chromiiresistens]
MTEPLRWGILATGGIARMFTNDLRRHGFDVRAVGSRSEASAARFADEFEIERVHDSYESLVNDSEVDVVYVATPHPMHAENAVRALEAGKHVLVEKAFTLNEGEARRIADAAEANGRVALEAMWTRYLPHMVRIRELIEAGVLGEVRGLIADHTQLLSEDPLHRLNALELGGGALLDLGIYPISFAWDLFGEPAEITATATFKPTGADAQVSAVFGYEGGRMASTFSASNTQGPNTAVVLGSEARIDIDSVWYSPTTFRVVRADGEVIEEYVSQVDGRGMQYQAAALERCVAEGRLDGGDILPTRESVAIMGTLDRIRTQIGLVYPGE